MRIGALEPHDRRTWTLRVATPAALLVSKVHKIAERADTPDRLTDKDAHDVYRLLVATPTGPLATAIQTLQGDPLAGEVTRDAMLLLEEHFAVGPQALGPIMAGRAEEGIGDPAVVAAALAALTADLLAAMS